MKRRYLLITAALCSAVLLTATGCQKETVTAFPGEDETYAADVASLGVSNRFAGVVTSSGETKIEKDDSKTIDKLNVSAGDDVKKGQLLFTYDSEQAQLNYDKAALELEQLNYSLQAYTDQKAELEREKLAASADDQLSYSLQIQETDTNIRETNYNIKVKQKEVEKLESGLENLEVSSPIDGKVQSINSDGSMDMSGSSLPFMVIMNTGTYRVKAYINEANAMELYEGAPVIVRSRVDDSTWTGSVASVDFDNPASQQQGMFVEDSLDTTNSSRYPFYVTLDDADGLILGQHVYVEVDIEFSAPASFEEEGPDADMDMEMEMGMDMDMDMDMEDMTGEDFYFEEAGTAPDGSPIVYEETPPSDYIEVPIGEASTIEIDMP